MTELELRNRIHDAVSGALRDEGVLTVDQATVIGRAVMGAIDVLVDVGAVIAPRLTRRERQAK